MRTTQRSFFKTLTTRKGHFTTTNNVYRCLHEKRTGLCPVCVVARLLTGERFENSKYPAAAKAIGLDINFADKVAWAADYPRNSECKILVTKLFKAVGLAVPVKE